MIRTNKGFTLIELMVVIVIIGILAALAIPKFTDASVKAKCSEIPTVLGSYEHAQMAYIAESGAIGDVAALTFDVPTSKWFTYGEAAGGDGTYMGEAKADIGSKIKDGDQVTTSVPLTGEPTHGKAATFNTYLVNW